MRQDAPSRESEEVGWGLIQVLLGPRDEPVGMEVDPGVVDGDVVGGLVMMVGVGLIDRTSFFFRPRHLFYNQPTLTPT